MYSQPRYNGASLCITTKEKIEKFFRKIFGESILFTHIYHEKNLKIFFQKNVKNFLIFIEILRFLR